MHVNIINMCRRNISHGLLFIYIYLSVFIGTFFNRSVDAFGNVKNHVLLFLNDINYLIIYLFISYNIMQNRICIVFTVCHV